jgi:cytochrome P450
VNLIGNGVLALLERLDRLAELQANSARIPDAVEEFLRLDGPVNLATVRHTTEPITIADIKIPAGEVVLISLLAANRDPDRFERPAELDVQRSTTGHLAFGHGIHHCLGAPLARMEGRIALAALHTRFPRMRLAVDASALRWGHGDGLVLRGLTELPVLLGPPAA